MHHSANVRYVPFAEACDALFSVCYGENWRQKKPAEERRVNRSVITDLRVLITISKHLATGCDLDQLPVSMLRQPR